MMTTFLKSREAILALAILALLAVIAFRFPGFVAPANLANVLTDTSPLIILALGQMAVILTKCIDLSVAANLALCGMIAAILNGMGVPLLAVGASRLRELLEFHRALLHCGDLLSNFRIDELRDLPVPGLLRGQRIETVQCALLERRLAAAAHRQHASQCNPISQSMRHREIPFLG